jgi:hypothetical protein
VTGVPYELVRHASPRAFLERAEPWLLEREDEHNLHLSLAYARRDPGPVGTESLFGTVEGDGEVVGCVIRTPPHKLLVTSLPSEAASSIVEPVADVYDEIPAVLGPADSAEAVASAWVALKGGTSTSFPWEGEVVEGEAPISIYPADNCHGGRRHWAETRAAGQQGSY